MADTGIGIANEDLERVFDRFEQADGSTTSPHGGWGLGLALARQLVEQMGRHISMEGEALQVVLDVAPVGPLTPPCSLRHERWND